MSKFHEMIANGAIAQDNHPNQASSIPGNSGGGGLEVFPGASAASLDKVTSTPAIPGPPQSEKDLFDSVKPGPFGQDPITQVGGAVNHNLTAEPAQNGVGQLQDMGSERRNFDAGQYIKEIHPPEVGATGRGGPSAAG